MKFVLAVVLLPALLQANSLCGGPARNDAQCGPNFGGASCSNPQACCSRFGFCGIGPQWCNSNSLCIPQSLSKTAINSSIGSQPALATSIPLQLPTPMTSGAAQQPVWALSGCGKGNRVVALTFDDGPETGANLNLLQELRANNIKATFFSSPQADGPEQLPARCALVKNILADGHQLEQHSMTHPHFPSLTSAQIFDEINQSTQFLKNCGASPKLFRPPYGELTASQTTTVISQFGLPIVLWNIDPMDYDGASVDVHLQRITSQFKTLVGVGNSALIVLHELNEGNTPGLVTQLATYFRGLGYSFVTLDQCISGCKGPVCSNSPNDFPDILGAAASALA